MVNPPEKNVSPIPAGKYGKLTKRSTHQRHHVNEGKSGLEPERVCALGALCSVQTKSYLAAEKQQERYSLSNEDKQQWLENYVQREITGARMRVEDAEAAMQREQEEMRKAENAELTNRAPEMTFQELLVAIRDSLCDLANSHDGEDGEDEDNEETEQGKLSKDDKPSRLMGTISKTV